MPPAVARPFKQKRASTVFLRVPKSDWPKLMRGRISEFRAAMGNVPQLWKIPVPTLVVCYREGRGELGYDSRLMLLEGVRQEMLSGISKEGLERAGYDGPYAEAFARFRREWTIREKRKFEPRRKVFVFRVRAFEPTDIPVAGEALIKHLYREHLPSNGRQ